MVGPECRGASAEDAQQELASHQGLLSEASQGANRDSSCFIEIIVLNSIIKGGVGRVRVPSECFRGMERGQE
jgi:hypothetical protein